MENIKLIKQARDYQMQIIDDYQNDPYNLISHLDKVNRWAEKLLKMFSEADRNVVLLAGWLHDAGHYAGDPNTDHAVKSEQMARDFLSGKIDDNIVDRVCRSVRAHRCKDVMPETIEEKITACIDSASHMTDAMYIDIARSGRFNYCLAKIDRDFRDVGLIPEIQKELEPLHRNWIQMITNLKNVGVFEETETYTEKV